MKTNTKNLLLALGGVAMLVLATPVLAQSQSAVPENLAASPRFRQQMVERKGSHTFVVATVPHGAMNCPKCQDQDVARVDHSVRGANQPITHVVAHMCGGCRTDWQTTGAGKAKQSLATHECSISVEQNRSCCAPKTE